MFDAQCKAAESTWQRQISRGLKQWLNGIKALARDTLQGAAKQSVPPAPAQRFGDELAAWMEENGIPLMRTIVWPLVFTTAEKATRQAAAKVGVSFSVFEDAILAYAERETAWLVDVMAETTEKAVVEAMTASVQEGLAGGDLIRDLTKRLESDLAFSPKRARLVARTETTRAWNGSQRSSLSDYAKRSGQRVEKSWLSSRDDRVREEHDELDDGTFIPIDAVFGNGLTEPGEPNCRCTLVYQISDPFGREAT
jgi:SPP1 gp7 family putative phage head morphogenesis protein